MCTVSVVALAGGGVRVLCSRDEQRSRRRAEPVAERACGDRRAIFPRDPDGGGTWVGVNDAGVGLALLNRTDEGPGQSGMAAQMLASRGEIIPGLLRAGSLDEVVCLAEALDPGRFRPFRLMAFDVDEAALTREDGGRVRVVWRERADEPRMETSSGLGDHLVERPRRGVFDQMVLGAFAGEAGPDGVLVAQAAFHAHRWPDRPELSVDMTRADAETVSLTELEIDAGAVRIRYLDGHPRDADGERWVEKTLRVVQPVAR
ncbi:MAG: NRDE family protein [Planctomycetota bacterium]